MIVQLKKMKCTPETNGCASCRVLNLLCRVTDRVTGETHVRGAVGKMMLRIDRLTKTNEDLKRENEQLIQQNALQKRNYDLLETECYLLRSENISVRDELHHTNHPYTDDDAFAGEVCSFFYLWVLVSFWMNATLLRNLGLIRLLG